MKTDNIDEAIILAGGLGTRLKSKISNIPKPMAPIRDKPFLEYIVNFLRYSHINKIIISVGYKANIIKNYFKNSFEGINILYSEEKERLGTGGAIKKALKYIKSDNFLVLNGDTYFKVSIKKMYEIHNKKNADVIIALKHKNDIERFGNIKIDDTFKIIDYEEKGINKDGLINGGIYIINKTFFNKLKLQRKFSIEKDLFKKGHKQYNFYGIPFENYFIDIGIPEDYERAKKELPNIN